MAREKKITVKPFLNKSINSKSISIDSSEFYPLYCQVIYDKRTTRFQLGNNWFAAELEDDLLASSDVQKLIEIISKIVRYEAKRNDQFTIKGIGDRFKSYCSKLETVTVLLLVNEISTALSEKVTHSVYTEWDSKSTTEKIQSGLRMLHGDGPESMGRLLNLGVVVKELDMFNLSLYDWLLGKHRKKAIEKIATYAEQAGDSDIRIEDGSGITYELDYPFNASNIIRDFDQVAHIIIDRGINFVPSFDSVTYGDRKFRVTFV